MRWDSVSASTGGIEQMLFDGRRRPPPSGARAASPRPLQGDSAPSRSPWRASRTSSATCSPPARSTRSPTSARSPSARRGANWKTRRGAPSPQPGQIRKNPVPLQAPRRIAVEEGDCVVPPPPIRCLWRCLSFLERITQCLLQELEVEQEPKVYSSL